MIWESEAYQYLIAEKYPKLVEFYERLIEQKPENLTYYWYLGLAYLLQENESAAQSTLLYVFTEFEQLEIEQSTQDLLNILQAEAQRQEAKNNFHIAWIIRSYIYDFFPESINNLFCLIDLELKLNRFQPERLKELNILEVILGL
jgi:hypothetical protein